MTKELYRNEIVLRLCIMSTHLLIHNFTNVGPLPNKRLLEEELLQFAKCNETDKKPLKTFQEKILSLPVLTTTKSAGEWTLDTNTCDKQIKIVILQAQSSAPPKPVCRWSQSLVRAKCNIAQMLLESSCWIGYISLRLYLKSLDVPCVRITYLF